MPTIPHLKRVCAQYSINHKTIQKYEKKQLDQREGFPFPAMENFYEH